MANGTPLSSEAIVAVIGAGAMGAGIAQVAAMAGHRVVLHDARELAAIHAIAGIETALHKLAERGKLAATEVASIAARLSAAESLADCKQARLVIEAIVEDLSVKRELFAKLEDIVGEDAVLATNTSSISVTSIGATLRRPKRLVGMHFFNPAPLMQLVEVVSGMATEPEVADTVFATAAAWGKVPVHTKSTPGFIVNRVARPYYAEGLRLLTEGAANVATLDAVMRDVGGFRMGPFELMDLIGHDVNYAVTRTVFDAFYGDPRFAPSMAQLELVNAGFLGRKSGRGFHDYREGAVVISADAELVAQAPTVSRVYGIKGICEGFVTRLSAVSGVELCSVPVDSTQLPSDSHQVVDIPEAGGACLYLTDGRTATERAQACGRPNTLVLDLAHDYQTSSRVVLAAADQCSPEARNAMVGLLQCAGWKVTVLDDVAGLAVMRTVCMLANEAAEAVMQGVCDAAAVDVAMKKGVNYPTGPLAWAHAIGLSAVCRVLDNMQKTYGEDRYRTSAWLRRKAFSSTLVAN